MTARAAYRVLFGAGLAAFFLLAAWGLVFSYLREGRLPDVRERVETLDDYRELASLQPRDPQNLTLLAEVLRRQGDLAGAAEAYERALRLDPRALDLRIELVRVRLAEGRLDEARRSAREALAAGAQIDAELRSALDLRAEP